MFLWQQRKMLPRQIIISFILDYLCLLLASTAQRKGWQSVSFTTFEAKSPYLIRRQSQSAPWIWKVINFAQLFHSNDFTWKNSDTTMHTSCICMEVSGFTVSVEVARSWAQHFPPSAFCKRWSCLSPSLPSEINYSSINKILNSDDSRLRPSAAINCVFFSQIR